MMLGQLDSQMWKNEVGPVSHIIHWKLTQSRSNPLNFRATNYKTLRKHGGGAVLRWQRTRTGRLLSPPQIHWKNIWTLSKFHKTTSECQQRTSGTQKGSPLSLKGGRTKYKRWKERQRIRDGDPSQKGSLRRSFQTPRNPLTGGSVGSFGISEGNITRSINK